MRSSSLNEHLYIRNIIDSPNCFCGEIESTHHYLFKCLKYTRQRNSLFRKLLQLLNIRPSENLLLYLAVQTLISIQILLFLRQCINIFRKVNNFYKIHKIQIHHVIFYLECNLQFPFFLLLPLISSYFNNVKWIEYVLMTICNFSCVFFLGNRLIFISVTLVSESYVILYCGKKM